MLLLVLLVLRVLRFRVYDDDDETDSADDESVAMTRMRMTTLVMLLKMTMAMTADIFDPRASGSRRLVGAGCWGSSSKRTLSGFS